MVVVFKPIKMRKSFFTKKAVWVSGINMETREYTKGLVSATKKGLIDVIDISIKDKRSLVVSINTVRNRNPKGKYITWINPGTQVEKRHRQ